MLLNYVVFSVSNNYYLYDGVSSNILSISKELFENHSEIFKNIESGAYKTDKQFTAQYKEILEAVNDGLLAESNKSDLNYWFEKKDFIQDFRDEISHLMIGVTEKCNLRCKYCVFSGHYPNERVHGKSNIDKKTLKNSLTEFFKISRSKDKIINFYGGEPLENFEAIKYATEYANSIDNSIMIFATTNGTLLNESVCDWFIQNGNVHFYVSMAGTPFVHDKLRVTATGNQTFDLIKSNLMKLKEKDRNAYNTRIHFVFNVFSAYQLLELDKYWNNYELFRGMQTQPETTFIDCENDDGYVEEIGKQISLYYSNKYPVDLLDTYVDLLKKKKYNHLLVRHFDEIFLNIHRRPDLLDNYISGTCKPFVKKVFVDIHGNVNLCENFISKDFFGNVNSEVKINKANIILEKYKINREKTCKRCWASKLCSLCFRDMFDSDCNVDLERVEAKCKKEREYIKSILAKYCYIMEKDNTILDHLNDYVICL